MTDDQDDVPTVRVRKSSLPAGTFSAPRKVPVSCHPDVMRAHEAIDQLDRDWANYVANLLKETESLRHTERLLREENKALRDTLHAVRGPR